MEARSPLFSLSTTALIVLVGVISLLLTPSQPSLAAESRGLPESFPRLESLVYPVSYPRLSGVFGSRIHPIQRVKRHHAGVDLAAPEGAIVRVVTAGRVVFADWHGGYGKLVVVQHGGDLTTHYGHLSEISVRPGQYVLSGEKLGAVGTTGNSTGPHLHFEVRRDGTPLDPMDFLPDFGAEPSG